MRYIPALLLILISEAVAISADELSSPLEGTVAVIVSSEKPTPEPVLQAMRREVEMLVSAAGIQVVWPTQLQAASQSYPRLALITLQGQCQTNAKISAALRFNRTLPILGKTHVVDGRVLPIADLKCDAVHKIIDRDLSATIDVDQAALMGRALGRVLAHELYHILLRTEQHGTVGLARPSQTSQELLAANTVFAPTDEIKLSAAFTDSETATESGR